METHLLVQAFLIIKYEIMYLDHVFFGNEPKWLNMLRLGLIDVY